MCYDSCRYWQRYSETCRKPRHAQCPEECEEGEEPYTEDDFFWDKVDKLYAEYKDEHLCRA